MSDLEFLGFANDVSTLDPIMYQYFRQLLQKRTIILNSEIDESILETVVLPLKDFEQDTDDTPVTLILNTPGGSVADGLMLCNVIDNYTKPLEILVPVVWAQLFFVQVIIIQMLLKNVILFLLLYFILAKLM